MAVTLRKAFVDPWSNKPVHESVLHARRNASGKRLHWNERARLEDNGLQGLCEVLRNSPSLRRYVHRFDDILGSWGTWDRKERRFVGHTGTQAGARVQARRMNQEENA